MVAAGAEPSPNGEELCNGDEVKDVEVADAPEPEVACTGTWKAGPCEGNQKVPSLEIVGATDCAGLELTNVVAAGGDPKLIAEEL